MRPAPISPTLWIAGSASLGSFVAVEPGLRVVGAAPGPRTESGSEDNALLRVDADENRAADGCPQRGMLARQQRTCADRDAEVDGFSEKHLLLHGRPPDVFPGRTALEEAHVLGPDRDRDAIVGLH